MKRAVVDQPGLKYILSGLVLSIFLGLLVRSQIAPHRLKNELNRYVEKIELEKAHQKLKLNFNEAEVKLTDWGIPGAFLIVKNIKISSGLPSCTDNQIYIDSLVLPINLWDVIFSKKEIDKIRLGLVELRTSHFDKCLSDFNSVKKESGFPIAEVESFNQEKKNNSNELAIDSEKPVHVFIERLKLLDRGYYDYPILLQSLNLHGQLLASRLVKAEVNSQFFLFKDSNKLNYQLRSNLDLQYENRNQLDISAKVSGKLIDKNFNLKFDYDHQNQIVKASHSFENVSLKAALTLLNSHKNTDGLTGISISSQGSGEYNLKSKQFDYYKVQELSMTSESGHLSAREIQITQLSPLKYQPFELKLNNFDMSKLKYFYGAASLNKSIDSYGLASGKILVKDNEFEAQGQMTDAAVIFSNKGRRAIQKIDKFSFVYKNNQLKIDDIQVEGKPVSGGVALSRYFSPEKDRTGIKGSINVSKINLNSEVFKIFELDLKNNPNIQLNAQFDNSQLHVRMEIDQLQSDSYDIKKVDFDYLGGEDPLTESNLNLKVKTIATKKSFWTKGELVYGFLNSLEPSQDEYKMGDFNLNLKRNQINIADNRLSIRSLFYHGLGQEIKKFTAQSNFKTFDQLLFEVKVTSFYGHPKDKFQFYTNLNKMTYSTDLN